MRLHQLTLLIGSSTLKTRVWDRNERLWEAQVHQPGQRQPALSCCRWLVQWHEAAYCSVPERFGHTAGTPELWNQVSSKTSTWMKKRRSAVRIFCASAISTWTWAHCMRIQRGCLHPGGWTCQLQFDSHTLPVYTEGGGWSRKLWRQSYNMRFLDTYSSATITPYGKRRLPPGGERFDFAFPFTRKFCTT